MTIDDRIIELENRITKLNDDILTIDTKIVEQKVKFKEAREKIKSTEYSYSTLKDFVAKNNPTGINSYDEKHLENETLSSSIDSVKNEQLHQLKKEVEEARLQYNKAKELRKEEVRKIEQADQIASDIDNEMRETGNYFSARASKYAARYEKESYHKGERKIYIPLAIVVFLIGCAINLPVGLIGGALAIVGTVVVRKIKRRETVKNMGEKPFQDMTKKEQKAYIVDDAKKSYQVAKEKIKPAYQQSLSSEYANNKNRIEQLEIKKQIDDTILNKKEENYHKAIKKFNSFLTFCNNKQEQLKDTEKKFTELKSVEDGIMEILNQYSQVKQTKQEEIAQRKQEIENLKNGTSVNTHADSKAEESGKGRRS